MATVDSVALIKSLGKEWENAWNMHDTQALAGLIAENGDFVTVLGLWLKGRREFEAHHAKIHKMQFRDSVWTSKETDVRLLREDLAIAHVKWHIEGDRNLDGTSRQPRNGIFTWTVGKKDGNWLIEASQNTNVLSD